MMRPPPRPTKKRGPNASGGKSNASFGSKWEKPAADTPMIETSMITHKAIVITRTDSIRRYSIQVTSAVAARPTICDVHQPMFGKKNCRYSTMPMMPVDISKGMASSIVQMKRNGMSLPVRSWKARRRYT